MDPKFLQEFRDQINAVLQVQDNPPPDFGAWKVRLMELSQEYVRRALAERDFRPMPDVLPTKPFCVLEPLSGFGVAPQTGKSYTTDPCGGTIVYDGETILIVDNRQGDKPETIAVYLWVPNNGQETIGGSITLPLGVPQAMYRLSITGDRLIAQVAYARV